MDKTTNMEFPSSIPEPKTTYPNRLIWICSFGHFYNFAILQKNFKNVPKKTCQIHINGFILEGRGGHRYGLLILLDAILSLVPRWQDGSPCRPMIWPVVLNDVAFAW